jgi:hypothetical protein
MAAPMPINRAGLAAAVINDSTYVMGGGHNIFTMDSTTVMQYVGFTNPATEMKSLQIIPDVTASAVITAVVALCILFYFKKRKSWCP